MNFHSFSNSSVWRSAGAPNAAHGFSANVQGHNWGARGPSVVSDNSGFWAANKWGASGGNADNRSWGGRGTDAHAFPGDHAHAGAGNSWGARGPSVVSGGREQPVSPNWNGGTLWSKAGSDRAWGGAGSGSWNAPHRTPAQWALQSFSRGAEEVAPAAAPARPVAGWSWANSSGSMATAPQHTASGSAGWVAGTPPGTASGSDAQRNGIGWANGETASQLGSGSHISGDNATSGTASVDGGANDWFDTGSGSDTGNAAVGGDVDNMDGSGWVDGGISAGEPGNDATDPDLNTGPGGETAVPPVELNATQKIDNIRFLSELVGNESPSEADTSRLVQIYNSFRLSPAELTALQTMAQNASARMFATEGQDFALHAQNWANYTDEERQVAITAFFEGIRDEVGLETSISFYNAPPTDAGLVSHGHYNPEDDTLSVNINSEVHETLPEVMTTVFHEIVHATYFQETADVATDDVPALLENGDLTYAQALTRLNVFPPLYISEEQHGLVNYTLNPHEQFAFTGQYLFDQAIIDAGYNHERVIANDNPLFINMQQHGFA